MSQQPACAIGLESLCGDSPGLLEGKRFALLANRASIDSNYRFSWDLLANRYPGQLTALLTPQHGLWGDAQANMIESSDGWHDGLEIPIYSLYSETRTPTGSMLQNIDWLIVDLQDVGTRVYTFIWTLLECLRACARRSTGVMVLDRPNPIGGCVVEGPILSSGFESFVGNATIPMRHGLTMGEMARFFVRHFDLDVELKVVSADGWDPKDTFDRLRRPWLPPSPNLPTPQSTVVYPGQVLFEGINVSEGRGTTTPFEILGAPFVDPERLIREMAGIEQIGVRLLPLYFRPTFDKWVGQLCGGLTLHVADRQRFRIFDASIRLIQALYSLWPQEFRWLSPPYEYETEKPPIDILYGSDRLRREISSVDPQSLCEVDVEGWRQAVADSLLYGSASRLID